MTTPLWTQMISGWSQRGVEHGFESVQQYYIINEFISSLGQVQFGSVPFPLSKQMQT
jgi:hypothetical protein